MENLHCTTCKGEFPASNFHKAQTTTRGYQYRCKTCTSTDDKSEPRKAYQRDKVKEWRAKNPEKRDAQKARHYIRNKEKIDQKAKDWYNNNRDRYRDKAFRRKYGITLEQYNLMREQQNYCCAICGTSETDCGKKMFVDHNHCTGAVRKLLCTQCNAGIGMLQDDPNILERAAKYIREHNG
jgi:hypothetical protein